MYPQGSSQSHSQPQHAVPAEHWCGGRGHPACTHCLHRPACTRSGHLPTLHPPLCTPSLRRVSGTSEPQTPAKLNPELCSGAGSPGQAASVRDIPPRGTRLTTSQRQIITTQHTSSGSCPGGVPALRSTDPRSPTFRTVTCARLLPRDPQDTARRAPSLSQQRMPHTNATGVLILADLL